MNMDMDDDTFPVLYNDCYGRFQISQKAMDEYNRQCVLVNRNTAKESSTIMRTDLLMCKLCLEMGIDFNGKYSHIKVKYLPKKYENYYTITDVEWDGREEVTINYLKYYNVHNIPEKKINYVDVDIDADSNKIKSTCIIT